MTYALKYLQVRMGLQFVAMEEFYSEENILSMMLSIYNLKISYAFNP